MKIKILGCHGSEGPKYKTTSFLINDSIAIDAGSLVSSLPLNKLKYVTNIFITHSHLDHIKDLAFVADNLFEKIKNPINIFSKPNILDAIHRHLFNDVLWPDFSKLPSKSKPTIKFVPITGIVKVGGLSIEAVEVNHSVECVGFIIRDKKSTLAITGDTGPTKKFWTTLKKEQLLKALFAEVSFPSTKQGVASKSHHFTPTTLSRDLALLKAKPKVYVYHLKPPYIADITKEIKSLGKAWHILSPGKTIKI